MSFRARSSVRACVTVLFLALTPAAHAAAAKPAAVPDSALASYDGGMVLPQEFVRSWWNLSPDRRPTGGALKARITFLGQVVDRKLLAREARRGHYQLTLSESLSVERTRDALVQNALFDQMAKSLPPITEEMVERYRLQKQTLAEVRFVSFHDLDRARVWRQRLMTGTPVSALDAAIAREGEAFAVADTFRFVAAEQIPDTLATVIWSMRPGQVSEIHSFGGSPSVVLLRTFAPRKTGIPVGDASSLRLDLVKRQYEALRQRFRNQLAEEVHRTFDDSGIAVLLAAHLLVPGRSDIDSVTGMPIMRPNLALPVVAPADTGKAIARVRDRVWTVGDYLDFWGRVQPFARPEIRERASLEGAIDRVVLGPDILRVAREKGFNADPALLQELADQREGYMLDHFFHDRIEPQVKVTTAALRAFYAKDPTHYDDRASIRSHIIMVDRKTQADSLLAQLRGGASFSEVARTWSMDGSTAQNGGDAGTQYRGTQPNAGLEDAMFATPVGQLGGPEKTPQGWILWRIDGATPGIKRNFEQARPMVERDFRILEADRLVSELLARLRRENHVHVYEERVTTQLGRGGPWED